MFFTKRSKCNYLGLSSRFFFFFLLFISLMKLLLNSNNKFTIKLFLFGNRNRLFSPPERAACPRVTTELRAAARPGGPPGSSERPVVRGGWCCCCYVAYRRKQEEYVTFLSNSVSFYCSVKFKITPDKKK